jgi:branched-chain amino acid transport system substrate-binding protein
MKGCTIIGVALGLILGLGTNAFGQDEEIMVGIAGPLTGGEASFGQQMKNGAEQAAADINALGGVPSGKAKFGAPPDGKVKIVFADDACNPEQARSVAKEFVTMKVPVVIGHFCSASSIAASKVYLDGGVLQITPATTNPLFTDRVDMWNTFRVCGRDDQQGAFAAQYLAKNYAAKKIAIVHDETTYGQGLADETRKALNAAGVREKLHESYNRGDKDFTALVARLKREAIEVVYLGGYHQEIGLLVRQMRDQGLKAVVMAGDSLADKEFASITGPSAEGVLFTFGPDARKNPIAAPVTARFKAKGIDPEGYTLYTYAALQTWAAAAVRTGTPDARKVAKTLKETTWDSVLGPLSFDEKGDTTPIGWAIYKWDKTGKYDEVAPGSRT